MLHLIGWVVGRDAAAVSVDLLYEGEVLRTTPVRGPREDVARQLESTPPRIACSTSWPASWVSARTRRLELEVVLADGTRVPVGWISLARPPLRSGFRAESSAR